MFIEDHADPRWCAELLVKVRASYFRVVCANVSVRARTTLMELPWPEVSGVQQTFRIDFRKRGGVAELGSGVRLLDAGHRNLRRLFVDK